ncbi:threonine synthase [soil metagenome]
MHYYSTNNRNHHATLKEAVIRGQAPDKGLYMPERIPTLPDTFYHNLRGLPFDEIAFKVAWALFRDDMELGDVRHIVEDSLNFPIPLVKVEPGMYSLELFHGPTLAFKDVGARFMARLLGHFLKNEDREVTVLVATSGDTGSAVAHGFLGVPGIKVVILYPSGKVSPLQEKQLTTLGQNITALEVDGSFDDCQALVKQAFADTELNARINLTSANSINIARLIPQSFYYHYAWSQVPKGEDDKVVVCVPSGNFGNLTAGLIAKRMGLPIHRFVAATNANDVVPQYLKTGLFTPRPSVATLSNAMDVGHPSNFARMMDLYGNSQEALAKDVVPYTITDADTNATIQDVLQRTGYLLDPHGAVSCLALKQYLQQEPATGIFLETAHPAKFIEVVEAATAQPVTVPEALESLRNKTKLAHKISAQLEDLKQYL